MIHQKPKIEAVIFGVVLLIAIFFRFYQLDSIPPGLWPDEAANGVDALKALNSGDFKIFYSANNGREGLFINLQALSIKLLGPTPFALRVVSAIIGIFTVLGLYLLTKRLFNWQTAAAASFFMAVSFWHVNFSRIGFRAIMLPFILVWGFYFLWRGLRSGKLAEFLIAGFIYGLGFYTYFSFRIVPVILIVLFRNFWSYLRKDFTHRKYEYAKEQLLRGFVLFAITAFFVALPLGIYFYYQHPEDFLKREGRPISVFDQKEPLKELASSVGKTLAMFNFTGDHNPRHNIPGSSQLALPIGVLFAIGFLKELIHWLKRKHGHFSTVHTLLFSWFFVMLLPGFLSVEAPHALRAIGAIPIVMMFAAKGFIWLVELVIRTHHATDFHVHTNQTIHKKESHYLLIITVAALMVSIGFWEYYRYFKIWNQQPFLKEAFAQKLVDIADYLNSDARSLPVYVLVNEGDVLVDGVSNNAQTIKFLTRTYNDEQSAKKNIYYIREEQISDLKSYDKFVLIPLSNNPDLEKIMKAKFKMRPENHKLFNFYKK